MTRRAHATDLFELFPDLPHLRHGTPEEHIVRLRMPVNATPGRATPSIARQREAAARVRAAVSARRRR